MSDDKMIDFGSIVVRASDIKSYCREPMNMTKIELYTSPHIYVHNMEYEKVKELISSVIPTAKYG